MDLEKLRYFQKVAEYEHITKAANDCYMTQPALSRIITQIEAEVGTKLFDREGRNLKLNDSGKIVYDCVSRIIREINDMQEQLSAMDSGYTGSINFATTFPCYETDWIGGCVTNFLKGHPLVLFTQSLQSSFSIRDALLTREVDLAISDQPVVDNAIEWQEVFSEQLGVVLSVDHPLAKKEILHVSELSGCDFLCNNNNSQGRDMISFICEKAGFIPKIVFRGDYPHYIDYAVEHGLGITFVTEGAFLARKYHNNQHTVVFRPVAEEYCRRVYGLAVLKNRAFPKIVQDFISIIRSCDVPLYRKQLVENLRASFQSNL